MFFATTKGKHVYSDPDYRDMNEVFILLGKRQKDCQKIFYKSILIRQLEYQ